MEIKSNSSRRIQSITMVAPVVVLLLCVVLTSTPTVSAQGPLPAGVPAEAPTMMADSPTMSDSDDCFSKVLNMSDCLTYVETGSNLTTPDKGCCPSFAGLVESSPICLCQLLGNSSSLGIQLDVNKSLNLPKVCKVETPPVSLCATIGIPVGASSPGGSMSPGGAPTGSMEAMGPMAMGHSPDTSLPPSPNTSSFIKSSILVYLFGLVVATIL
ncbi:hypothetical protein C5167_046147 [Papaver somniferum]|uniref:Bifunctional inhibitor/plant lipid transfer protein/seed storage helical domain-containing protein n=1 Tax=Papaver somniferum TaxID=3469 RepID=A0A4Y7LF90_PAPSO|nr:non-specific lipid transfer protein GPI-anchored 2-like [Papaver somniferum]RZC83362.1 hypothetical protein C5167_046147 [Papaver somniferum]